MEKKTSLKYLGDVISVDGTNTLNLDERRQKAYAIVSEIVAILREVPLGKFEIEAGLKLRNAMFINGILTNCEIWYGMKKEEISMLQEIDEYLVRKILKLHSKIPKDTLYLETGILPIKYIMMSRRLNYWHHIITRKENELIYRVYQAQKRVPIKDDWVLTLNNDKLETKFNLSENEIKNIKKNIFKKIVKKKVTALALHDLNKIKESHSKVQNIKYVNFNIKKYIISGLFNTKEICLLFKIRTRMLDVKINFRNFYADNKCRLCEIEEETQNHLLNCPELIKNCPELYNDMIVKYEDIFSDNVKKQHRVTKLYIKVLAVWEKMTNNNEQT